MKKLANILTVVVTATAMLVTSSLIPAIAATANTQTAETQSTTIQPAAAQTIEQQTATANENTDANTPAVTTNATTATADVTQTAPTNATQTIPEATPTTDAPSIQEDLAPTTQTTTAPAATQPTTTYAHSETATQGAVTLKVEWNDPTIGEATTFHVSATGGSGSYLFRMDAPSYSNPGEWAFESVADPSRGEWTKYTSECQSTDYEFTMTATGTYNFKFFVMDKAAGLYYLRCSFNVQVSDAAHPSVAEIVNDAVAQAKSKTDGSEYAMALWLHDWLLDQLEYDNTLKYSSAEAALTRGLGTCQAYESAYAKLLTAANIENEETRDTEDAHTWNAMKIDGTWCQVDCTWDDTNDKWYGDLDQRHLYFGLTDELMLIAHPKWKDSSDSTYGKHTTTLGNNYFVRNGKADEWADAYTERIQQHLDAKEENFSIDADNASFPPSISGIQNAIVAYVINQKEWSNTRGTMTLTATSNITTNSSSSWTTKFDFVAKQQKTTDYTIVYHKTVTSEAVAESTPVIYEHSTPTFTTSELGFSDGKSKFLGWRCFRDSDNTWWATLPNGKADWMETINGRLPDGCTYRLLPDGWNTGWSTRSGSVHLYGCWQKRYSVQYHASLGSPAIRQITNIEVGNLTPTLTPSELGLANGNSEFLGWRCYRDENGTWWTRLPNGTCSWVKESGGQLPAGCTYALLPAGFESTWTAESGIAHFYAVWKGSYTLGYRQSAADAPLNVTTNVTYGKLTKTPSVSDLGFKMNEKDFVGWRCFRDVDQKWWATLPSGKADWVALQNGVLPEGCTFRLLPNEWQTGWSATSGNVELVATWRNFYTVSCHFDESSAAHPASTDVTVGRLTSVPTIAELGYKHPSKSFEGWKCYRDSDGKWWVTKKNGQVDWVQPVDGDLPSGCTYRLLPDGWKTAWSTWTGNVQLFATWR